MPAQENERDTSSILVDLKTVPEKISGTQLIVTIDDVRATQLSPEAKEELNKTLEDIAARILTEGRRIAASGINPFDTINEKHLTAGLIVVIEKWYINISRKRKWRLTLESLGTGILLSTITLAIDRHFYSAVICSSFSAAMFWCFHYFGDE